MFESLISIKNAKIKSQMFAVYSLNNQNERVPICIFSGSLLSLSAIVKHDTPIFRGCGRSKTLVKIKAVCLDENRKKKIYSQTIRCSSEAEAHSIMSEILEEYETTNEISKFEKS